MRSAPLLFNRIIEARYGTK